MWPISLQKVTKFREGQCKMSVGAHMSRIFSVSLIALPALEVTVSLLPKPDIQSYRKGCLWTVICKGLLQKNQGSSKILFPHML